MNTSVENPSHSNRPTVASCRISVVFRVRSARAIKISDADLLKRLCGIVLIFAIFLSVRMVVGRPRVVKGIDAFID